MFCSECGNRSDEGASFCRRCGIELAGLSPATAKQNLPPGKVAGRDMTEVGRKWQLRRACDPQ